MSDLPVLGPRPECGTVPCEWLDMVETAARHGYSLSEQATLLETEWNPALYRTPKTTAPCTRVAQEVFAYASALRGLSLALSYYNSALCDLIRHVPTREYVAAITEATADIHQSVLEWRKCKAALQSYSLSRPPVALGIERELREQYQQLRDIG